MSKTSTIAVFIFSLILQTIALSNPNRANEVSMFDALTKNTLLKRLGLQKVSIEEVTTYLVSNIHKIESMDFSVRLTFENGRRSSSRGPFAPLDHQYTDEQYLYFISQMRKFFSEKSSEKIPFTGTVIMQIQMQDGSRFSISANDRSAHVRYDSFFRLIHPNGKKQVINEYPIKDPQGLIDELLRVGKAIAPDHELWSKTDKEIEPHPLFERLL